MTAKPMYFQVMIPSRVQIARSGFESQSWAKAPRPIFSSSPLSAPLVWSMRLQPVPTTTSAIT